MERIGTFKGGGTFGSQVQRWCQTKSKVCQVYRLGRTKFEAQTTILGGGCDDRALAFELVFTYTPWGKL